jgi:hypothetical protein
LARSETPESARFIRKASPDGGVECFCVLEDADEWGWQAKYFTAALRATQWKQLDDSVKSALETHPHLTRYYVCVPRDRSDGRRQGITTEMQRWAAHAAKWEGWASEQGMTVEFIWWGSSELIERLSKEQHAGRFEFWFGDDRRFGQDWFKNRLAEARQAAGPRYTPEIHVDLPIARKLEMFARTGSAMDSIRSLAKDVRRAFATIGPYYEKQDRINQDFGLAELRQASDKILEAFRQLDYAPTGPLELPGIVKEIDRATCLVDKSLDALKEIERTSGEADTRSEDRPAYRSNPIDNWRSHLQYLQRELRGLRETLEKSRGFANRSLMIVKGEAGTGKTHLLCDFARRRVHAGLPTVILLGQRFTTTEEPWKQASTHLDLNNMSADRFVGALEAAAQASKARALLIIDALNEGHGIDVWPEHLAPLLSRLRRSNWVSVLLSVRSTYQDAVIPEQVRESAVLIEHHGFSDREYDAARQFFAHYGLEFPSAPILHPEFSKPLFLKTICEALSGTEEKRLPRGLQGVSTIFDLYLNAINRRVAQRIDYDLDDNLVRDALELFAIRLLDVDSHFLLRPEAKKVVDSVLPNRGYSDSLFGALVSEGVLLQDANWVDPAAGDEIVHITYQRFADHIIADYLLRTHLDSGNPAAAFAEGGGLAFVQESWRWSGLLEALCIQVPERCGQELLTLAPLLGDHPNIGRAFLQSIVWRDVRAFSDDTLAVLNDVLHRETYASDVFGTLLTVSTIPGHHFNAECLDRNLRQHAMPDRDAGWSRYLHYANGDEGPVDRLLDWATGLQPSNRDDLDSDVVDLSAIALTWMLTTANRFVRDHATKGLVALLTGRLEATVKLIERFRDVDDPYVVERVYGVAYGVVMRCHDPDSVGRLATVVYESVFASGEASPHILLRDYARGVIERAIHLGAAINLDEDLIQPPYRSTWPQIPSEQEIEALTPHWDDDTLTRWDPEHSRNRIRFSVTYDDFASYVIGTNFHESDWLSVERDDKPWRSPTERMAALEASLSRSEQMALSLLRAAEGDVPQRILRFDPDGGDRSWTYMASGGSGVEATEREYAEAQARVEVVRDQFVTSLTAEHATEYLSIRETRSGDEPRLDLSIVQRYVLWRVFDLGWTVERFGEFDGMVGFSYGRNADKAERIGKKYQWIAYHEALAYISDHYQYRERYRHDESTHEYRGPWQIHRRDIDPSCAPSVAAVGDMSEAGQHPWWEGSTYSDWREHLSDRDWLGQSADFPDPKGIVRVVKNHDSSRWVNALAMPVWRQPVPPGQERSDVGWREVWLHATGYFIQADDASSFLDWLRTVDPSDGSMRDPPGGHTLFVGEHGWSPAFTDTLGLSAGTYVPESRGGIICPTEVRAAAFEYHTRCEDYDCSTEQDRTILMAHPEFIEAVGLRWSGHGTEFVDGQGRVAAYDPTAEQGGSPALLLREDLLADYLEQTGSALVWWVVGEKIAVRADRSPPVNGWLQFSGAYRYFPGGIEGALSHRLQLPA